MIILIITINININIIPYSLIIIREMGAEMGAGNWCGKFHPP